MRFLASIKHSSMNGWLSTMWITGVHWQDKKHPYSKELYVAVDGVKEEKSRTEVVSPN